MAQDPRTPRPGLARRTFLQYSAGAGVLLSPGSVLRAYARGDKGSGPGKGARRSGDVVVEKWSRIR